MELKELGGRKFIFGIVLLMMSFILQILERDLGEFMTIAGVIYGFYIVGNVAQKKIK